MKSHYKWLVALLLCFCTTSVIAATSLTAGGHISAAGAGVVSADATVRVYRTAEPTEVVTGVSSLYAIDTWIIEVGTSLSDYQVGDELIAIIEKETDPDLVDHAGYYAVRATVLDGSDPVQFLEATLRAVPSPQVALQPDYVANLSWDSAIEDGAGNIVGYHVWRSRDGVNFRQVTSVPLTVTSYQDSAFPADNRYYAISLVYRSEAAPPSVLLSANSEDSRDSDGDGIVNIIDTDDDNDGMPDIWETANSLNPLSAADAVLDADSDNLTNLQEYTAGTDPNNADTDDDGIPDGIDPEPLVPAASYATHNDFDADGDSDILIRNITNGRWRTFTIQDMVPTSQSNIALWINQDWDYQDMADYDGDGDSDILLRNTINGNWRMFEVQNGTILSNATPALWRNQDYAYQGSADFDADGDADILLRNTITGYYRLFTVEDGTITGSVTLATLWRNPLWQYAGAGDFDNDGDADILLRNSDTGDYRLFTVQDSTITGSNGFNLWKALTWSLQGIADYDNDGDTDVLLRDINGYWQIFEVQDGQVTSSQVLYAWRNTEWETQSAVHDLDGDGDADLLLRSNNTGLWRSFTIEDLSITTNIRPLIWANQDWQLQ